MKRVVLLLTMLTFACGRYEPVNELKKRYDVPEDALDQDRVNAFVDQTLAVHGPAADEQIPMDVLFGILPMDQNERLKLVGAYTNPLEVNCKLSPCRYYSEGKAVEAKLRIDLPLARNPTIGLEDQIRGQILVHSLDKVEMCHMEGMYAKKFFITKKIQGLMLTKVDGLWTAKLNLGDDDENYTCQTAE